MAIRKLRELPYEERIEEVERQVRQIIGVLTYEQLEDESRYGDATADCARAELARRERMEADPS